MTYEPNAPGPSAGANPPRSAGLLIAITAGIIAVGVLISFVLDPSWQRAAATVLMGLVPWCVLVAFRRRASAQALWNAQTGPPEAGRPAARLHLQAMGLLLLAVALMFAAGGALSLLS